MAMQAGMGLTKVVILVGAGTYMIGTKSISELLGNLQALLNKESGPDADLVALVKEIGARRPASPAPIIIQNPSQTGDVTSLAVPAAVLGGLGYGYMWWKGLSLSDLMYVTKSSMANAVTSMTKHLEQVSSALAATKRHLTQRIENLDGKLDDQREMSKLIKDEVTDVRADISQIGFDLDSLRGLISGLDGKICSLEDKQDYANAGVWYLCNFVGGKDGKMGEFLKALPKPSKTHSFLGYAESQNSMGLKELADALKPGNIDSSSSNGIKPDDIDNSCPRPLSRFGSEILPFSV